MKTAVLILMLSSSAFGQDTKPTPTPRAALSADPHPTPRPRIVNTVDIVIVPKQSAYKGKVQGAIKLAQNSFDKGAKFLKENNKASAKLYFDEAISILMNAEVLDEEQPKLMEFSEKLQDLIYELEFGKKAPPKSAAESSFRNRKLPKTPKDEQGFTEQVFVPQNDELSRSLPSDEAILGKKPAQNKDGAVPLILNYFDENANDPYSMRFVKWSNVEKVYLGNEPHWKVTVKLRAKNAFNAYILSEMDFYIQHNKVVRTKKVF